MELPLLYLITDRHRTAGRSLPNVLQSALDGGVRMIQLREKDLPGKALFELASEVREMTKCYGAQLIINDRIDVALAVEADGVHLPADSFSPGEARRIIGEGKTIGVSTHSIEEATIAEREGTDFITFSPVFFTPSKALYGEPQGLERLREVCKNIDIPVYALGGVGADNIKEVKNAGTYGAAVVSAITAAHDVREESEKLRNLLDR